MINDLKPNLFMVQFRW